MTRIAACLAALITLVATAGSAHAAGPGALLGVAGLPLPPGGLPAADSGSTDEDYHRSEASADGRYVVFVSAAESLAPGAHPDAVNAYRKDRQTGAVVLVSRATGAAGVSPAYDAEAPRITADGQKVAWRTEAQLDPADTDTEADVYLRDLGAATTTLLTPGTATEAGGHDLSADGAYLAFATADPLAGPADANGQSDIYRRRLSDGATVLVSRKAASATAATGFSLEPAISGDGRWVTFISSADDLATLYTASSPGVEDVFARNLSTGITYLVSRRFDAVASNPGANGESQEPDIAGAPGDALGEVTIAFSSFATDLVAVDDPSEAPSIYVRNLGQEDARLVSRATGAGGVSASSRAHSAAITADGSLVAFASDAPNLGAGEDYYGVYLRDLDANTTVLGSAHNAYSVQPALAAGGSLLTWTDENAAEAPGGDPDVDGILARTLPGGSPELISRPPGTVPFLAGVAATEGGGDGRRTISADGRYVVFSAYARRLSGLPDQITQVYRRDLQTGALALVSRATGPAGAPAVRSAGQPSISADGRRVAFMSSAPLAPGDPDDDNAAVYVRDLAAQTTTLVSRATGPGGAAADVSASGAAISAGGGHVTFLTPAGNLGAPGGTVHAYLRDLAAATTVLVDRADGAAGAPAGTFAQDALPAGDGRLVVFSTTAPDLVPADPAPGADVDVFVRDVVAGTTRLVSRAPGPGGADTPGAASEPVISADGAKVAFTAADAGLAPGTGPWADAQIVLRDLASGQNVLVSRAAGGAPADGFTRGATIDATGARVAFQSSADNLGPAAPADGPSSRIHVRTIASGAITTVPVFGIARLGGVMGQPSLSDDGQCVAFTAQGHEPLSGVGADVYTSFVYVISGACPKPVVTPPPPPPPPGASAPVLDDARMTRRRFRVGKRKTARVAAKRGTAFRFTLSAGATVTIAVDRVAKGRRNRAGKCVKPRKALTKRCTRHLRRHTLTRALPAGAARVAYSGRVGKRRLAPGRYRATLRAVNAGGRSAKVRLRFRVVRR